MSGGNTQGATSAGRSDESRERGTREDVRGGMIEGLRLALEELVVVGEVGGVRSRLWREDSGRCSMNRVGRIGGDEIAGSSTMRLWRLSMWRGVESEDEALVEVWVSVVVVVVVDNVLDWRRLYGRALPR